MGFQANKAKQAQAAIVQRKANKEKRKLIFKRAEQYIKEYRQKERDGIRLNRMAKKHGNYHVPDQPRLALVIRIRGINPQPKGTKGFTTFPSSSDQQRCLCQTEQGNSSDAQNGRTNDHLGLP